VPWVVSKGIQKADKTADTTACLKEMRLVSKMVFQTDSHSVANSECSLVGMKAEQSVELMELMRALIAELLWADSKGFLMAVLRVACLAIHLAQTQADLMDS
jgi:hypothetical protein